MTYIYFGCIFPDYREQILRDFKLKPNDFPEHFLWTPTNSNNLTQAPVFSTLTGEFDLPHLKLKPHSIALNLIKVLSRDFYRGFSVAEIFAHLYPGEFYNTLSSPTRVHQALHRTRSLLSEMRLPLEIRNERGQFHLTNTSPIRLKVGLEQPIQYGCEAQFHYFLLKTDENVVSAKEVSHILDVSEFTAVACLNWGIEHRLVERIGHTKNARYSINRKACQDFFSKTPGLAEVA